MKKIWKRYMSVALCMMMMSIMLAACGDSSTSTGESTSSEVGDTSGMESTGTVEGGRKMGIIFYGKDDPAAAALYRNLNKIGEMLNCEIVWALGSFDPNEQLTDAQNLIAAGVEGIICVPLNDVASQKIMQLCDENEVFFSIFLRDIVDEKILEEVESSKYWVGASTEDNYALGAQIIQDIYDNGARKLGLLMGVGEQSFEVARNAGFYDKIEELGMEILAEAAPLNGSTDAEGQTENFLTSYPEMDGIAMVSGATGNGEIVMAALERNNRIGQVRVGSCDTFDGMMDGFEVDTLDVTAGGFYSDGVFNFMWNYNSVVGTPISDTNTTTLIMPVMFINSAEECELYERYVDTPDYDLFTFEDIQQLLKSENPDLTIEKYQEIMDEFTLENIATKAESRQ